VRQIAQLLGADGKRDVASQRPLRVLFCRFVWVVLLVGHAPALLSATRALYAGDGALGRVLILSLALTFFALKLFDVSWLRLPRTRRAWVAFTTAVVLIHAGALERSSPADAQRPDPWQAVVLGGGLGLLAFLAGGIRPALQTRQRAARRRARATLELVLSRIELSFLPSRNLMLARSVAVNRAPPR
jgi:hypothetical protein